MIRHRLYSLISSTTSAAARRSQQPTASTSASVQERSICSIGGDLSTKMIKPKAIVLSGPSGGGKSTILAKAMKDYPDSFAFSVSRLIINFINYSIFYLRHNKKTAERWSWRRTLLFCGPNNNGSNDCDGKFLRICRIWRKPVRDKVCMKSQKRK